ncbi:MAG: cellulase family glycosylhydrolase, partial [Phycisphaeraceae bacterium]|nr:cellulase family glycosylhydrolase [Phycisphaeraceae bacterium]
MAGMIAVKGEGFVDASTGERFVPIGCNYFDPFAGWVPKIWAQFDRDRVAKQFDQIAAAGLNTIRVFLSLWLSPSPGVFDEERFKKVDEMVALAGKSGLRIIFSGPNWWEGAPKHRYGDVFADSQEMGHCDALWAELGKRYGQNPTVMTWDLYNEPHVEWRTKATHASPHRIAAWRRHAMERLGVDVDDLPPRNVRTAGVDLAMYREYLRFLDDLSDLWVEHQCRAIRGSGAKNLISVGTVQWSTPILEPKELGYGSVPPQRVARHLDYVSQHFYPIVSSLKAGIEPEVDVQKAYLEIVFRAARVPGKPLVMEEFGWQGGKQTSMDSCFKPEEHQTMWCDALMEVTRRCGAAGWLNWPYADSPDP